MEAKLTTKGMGTEAIINELQDSDNYSGKYFYVSERARWNQGWDEELIKDGAKKIIHV